jgi:putative transposase
LRRAHQGAANARLNYIHHVSKWLVENYDLIAYEDLKIRNMVRSNLAKSIMDAAWGLLIWCVSYKAESAGSVLVLVDPRGTSQTCPECGTIKRKTLSERMHRCECGCVLDRDVAAAQIVLMRADFPAGTVGQAPSQRIAA